jgi:NAD(P)-dependent dehydrogenase (short-subunit alcohol dehydrogenase family)
MDLEDRVALLAGGSGLFGTAIGRSLAAPGAHVAITPHAAALPGRAGVRSPHQLEL